MMNNELLYFIIVMVQNVIITTYIDCVYDYKLKRSLSNIIIYLFLTILFIVTTPIINLKPLKLLIITITQILFFKWMSNNTYKESIKKTIILVALTLSAEIICDPIYRFISLQNNTRLDIDTASVFDTLRVLAGSYLLPVFMSIVLIYSLYYKKIKGPIKRKLIFVLLLIPVVLTFMHYIIYSYNIETFSNTTILFIFISSIIFMILIIAIYRLIMQLDTYIKNEKELELLKQKEQMQLEYYKIMNDKEENIRKINHDIKNNLQVIYTLKSDKDKQKLIEKIMENLKKYELVKYSSNDILNIILNTKVNEARNKDINIEIELKKQIDFIEDLDISNLFSNILDNAIENAKKTQDKQIDLKVNKKLNYVIIKCINTYDGKINKKNNNIITTKKDNNHGYGLKIIEDIVKKYNGEIEINHDDKKFTIIIMVPEKSK
ncbi:MAG: GHKL domain-containing protein [Firmicutes bacterium]|nr:GHKL domain-containing protein [Bacillota bacterium]